MFCFKTPIGVALLVLLSACGRQATDSLTNKVRVEPQETANTEVNGKEIVGVWKSQCQEYPTESSQETLEFSADKRIIRKSISYSKPGCSPSDVKGYWIIRGTFKLLSNAEGTSDYVKLNSDFPNSVYYENFDPTTNQTKVVEEISWEKRSKILLHQTQFLRTAYIRMTSSKLSVYIHNIRRADKEYFKAD